MIEHRRRDLGLADDRLLILHLDAQRGCRHPLLELVEPELRDEGLGSRMLEVVLAWARERGVEEIIVWPSERSYPFYERAGFSRTRDPLVLYLTAQDE